MGFLDIALAKKMKIPASGEWEGTICTMLGEKMITTPFFKVTLKLSQSQNHIVYCLGTSGIEGRRPIPKHIVSYVCKTFKIQADQLCTEGGACALLLGQDSGFLLLKAVQSINGVKLNLPPEAKNLNLEISPATKKYSLTGGIGGSPVDSMNGRVSNFSNIIMKSGNFEFAALPSQLEASQLIQQIPNCSITVKQSYSDVVSLKSLMIHDPPSPNGGSQNMQILGYFGNASTPQSSSSSMSSSAIKPVSNTRQCISMFFCTDIMRKYFRIHSRMNKSANLVSFITLLLTISTLSFPLLSSFSSSSPGKSDSSSMSLSELSELSYSLNLMLRKRMRFCQQYQKLNILKTIRFGHGYTELILPPLPPDPTVPVQHLPGPTVPLGSNPPPHHGNILSHRLMNRTVPVVSVISKNVCHDLDAFSTPKDDFIDENDGENDENSDILIRKFKLCKPCQNMVSRCPNCKFLNSTQSIDELSQFKLIKDNIEYVENEDKVTGYIIFNYPFITKTTFEELYRPHLSNFEAAKTTTKKLFRKLNKINKVQEFHDEILKSIDQNHIRILTDSEAKQALASSHCFSFLNFVQKQGSSSQKIRPVTNSSSHHQSGSINAHLPIGPNLLGSLKAVFERWRLKAHVIVSDLSRCYRSIYTTHRSGMMRLTAYPRNVEDASNIEDFVILFFLRSTYGDSPISCLLEIVVRFFVIPLLDNDLAVKILLDNRYVDDLVAVDDSKDNLIKAMFDLTVALRKVGFEFKPEFTSDHSWYDPNADRSSDAWLSIFSHTWFYNQDLLSNRPVLHPHKKVRGLYSGPSLADCDIHQLQITKRLLSRLSGQMFSLDGSQLGILKTQFSIYFGLVCKEVKTWDEKLDNVDLTSEIKTFLLHLKENLHKLQPLPRRHFPENFSPIAINGYSDGAIHISCFVFYLLSLNPLITTNNSYSSLAQAASRRKNHSVPANEALAILLLVENIYSYLMDHFTLLFPDDLPKIFTVNIASDSECSLWSLAPSKNHKSVLLRNLSEKVHLLMNHITRKFPLKVIFHHVPGDRNSADYNSKIHPNPVDLSNSPMWRHGPPESHFSGQSWPKKENIFMTIQNGICTWEKRIESKYCSCKGYLCSDSIPLCHCSSCLSSVDISAMASVSKISIHSILPYPTKATSSLPSNSSLTWRGVLDMLPIISDKFFSHLMTKMSIRAATSSCSRFLVRHFSDLILETFNLKKEDNIKAMTFPPDFLKIAFLTIIKKSNILFPPHPSNQKYQKVSDFYFLKSRYTNEVHMKVFGALLIPLISLKDSMLSSRCFSAAHIVYSATPVPCHSSCHLPLNITLTRWRYGTFATTASNLRSALSNQIAKCVTCIKRTQNIQEGRTYSFIPHNPVISGMLGKEDIFWSIISVDLITDIEVLAHNRARAKSTYKVSVLMAMDYISGAFCAIVIDDAKASSVMLGLQRLFIRHQVPRIIVSDAGSQILALHHDLEQLNIQLLNLPASHQFRNRIENTIKSAKKLMRSLRENHHTSVYHQPNSLIDLISKLELIEVVLNNRPIFVSTQSESANILTPHLLLHPQATEADLVKVMKQVLDDIFDPQGIMSLVGKDSRNSKNSLRLALVEYLQTAALRYIEPVRGHLQKPSSSEKILLPRAGDVIIFKHCDTTIRLGIILEVFANNMCDVRTHHLNRVEIRPMHVRLLKLLFRPSEIGPEGFGDTFGQINHDDIDKLLPNLDKGLDSCIA